MRRSQCVTHLDSFQLLWPRPGGSFVAAESRRSSGSAARQSVCVADDAEGSTQTRISTGKSGDCAVPRGGSLMYCSYQSVRPVRKSKSRKVLSAH